MSNIQITYARAMEFCPVQACEAIANLQKSRSKSRKSDPATLPWEFSWGVEVRGESFADLLSGRAAKRREEERAQTLEDRLEARQNAIRVSVCVKGYGAPLPRGVVPDEILSGELGAVTEAFHKEKAEETRLATLTPKQREAEVNDLLRQLGGMGGFAVVRPK